MQTLGRPGEVALLRDGDEVLELPEFHDSSPELLKGISFSCWTA
jgi:hypothetical protein